jgi:hypothetical protein
MIVKGHHVIDGVNGGGGIYVPTCEVVKYVIFGSHATITEEGLFDLFTVDSEGLMFCTEGSEASAIFKAELGIHSLVLVPKTTITIGLAVQLNFFR